MDVNEIKSKFSRNNVSTVSYYPNRNIIPHKVSKETNTILHRVNGILKASVYQDGNFVHDISVIPDIVDVEVFGNGKALKMTFSDGTFEKAVCSEDDYFNLEYKRIANMKN